MGAVKLGQPVPESNFVSDENSSAPQPAQVYIASSWASQKAPENARSVPLARRMAYCSGVSAACHSASDLSTRVASFALSALSGLSDIPVRPRPALYCAPPWPPTVSSSPSPDPVGLASPPH